LLARSLACTHVLYLFSFCLSVSLSLSCPHACILTFVPQLLQTLDITKKCITNLERERRTIHEAAIAHGYTLVEGQAFTMTTAAPIVDLHIQYVRVLLQLRNLDDMRGNAAAYVVAMDISGARNLISQSLDPDYRSKLEDTAERLRRSLGLPTPWTEEHPDFKVWCLGEHMCACVHASVCAVCMCCVRYVCMLRACMHAWQHAFLRACVHACLRACVPACGVHARVSGCVHGCVHACVHVYTARCPFLLTHPSPPRHTWTGFATLRYTTCSCWWSAR
jgi:hypothetical protein